MSIKDEIDQLIKQYPVFVISKRWCDFCKMTKAALRTYDIPSDKINIMEIENHKDMNEIQDYMLQLTGGRSVPRVFIGGEFIGGGSETAALHKAGELGTRIQTALSSYSSGPNNHVHTPTIYFTKTIAQPKPPIH